MSDGEEEEASAVVEVKVLPYALIDRLSGPNRIREGGSGVLEVVARSASTMRYQWYKDGLALRGEDGARLELKEVGAGEGGMYEVEVKNAAGSVRRGMRVGVIVFVGVFVGVLVAVLVGVFVGVFEGVLVGVLVGVVVLVVYRDWETDRKSTRLNSSHRL